MDADDLETVLARGFATLRAAHAGEASNDLENDLERFRGSDSERYVEAVVDGRGLLTDIVFSDDIGELTPQRLEAAVLGALKEAHRATGRVPAHALPGIGDSEVSAQARRVLGLEGE